MDKVQYLFYFSSDDLCLLEIKRTGLPAQASLSDMYKWLIYFKASRAFVPLSFISMQKKEDCECRSFSEAELKFDETSAEMNYQGTIFKLQRKDVNAIPAEIKIEVSNYLLRLT